MTKLITYDELQSLAETAQHADRRRSNLNIHDTLDEGVQRLFIATQPETYIRPHRHCEPHKWEFFIILEGRMSLLQFSDDGSITNRIELSEKDTRAIEIPPNTWHSYVCLEPNTIALEIKEGAYIPTSISDLSPWSPPENTPESRRFLKWMKAATIGDRPIL